MDPRIRYAKTSDGVSIAYLVLGEGLPLLVLPSLPWSNIELEWRLPVFRDMYERLATAIQLVRLDARGAGCSQREVTDFSLHALQLDLDAVASRLQFDHFSLMAWCHACPAGIAYAARNPGRISRLVLVGPFARGSDLYGSSVGRALFALRESGADWDLLTEASSRIVWGLEPLDNAEARAWAAMLRECVGPEVGLAMLRAIESFDVTDELGKVQAPTLVLPNPIAPSWPSHEIVRSVASRIPDARLASVNRTAGVASLFDDFQAVDQLVSVILDFVIKKERAPAASLPSGTAIILFADIASSTALTEGLGDAAFREKARGLDTALRGVIREKGGTPVEGKLLGDGVLAVFTSARQAIEAALACGRAGDGAGLPLHLGLHAGDVIREEDPDGRSNVYGGAVNIAARISALSAPGEVLVSDTLRGLARTSAGVRFEDRGEHALKGIDEPVRVWAAIQGGAS